MLNPNRRQDEQEYRAKYRGHEEKDGFNALLLAAELTRIAPDLRPFQVALDAAELTKLAKSLAALALHDCNHGLTPRQETSRGNLAIKVAKIASFYNLAAESYGDPRGRVVRLLDPNGGDRIGKNGWGEGFGIG